ncbi:ankyrin repeat family protein [Striga asiatica]|uniref:Ankyrin repeat family protein n=1 Tax=Striga asiatica TaxID=4170 RepID=A0A5A7NX47_STRAF|nr:ankyrin repeat family protein [Striga asiatica]
MGSRAATSSNQVAVATAFLLPHVPRHVLAALSIEILKAARERSSSGSLDDVSSLLHFNFFAEPVATYAVADCIADILGTRHHLHLHFFFFFFFFFFKFTLFTANLLLKIPLLIFFHFQLLNYPWPKLAIDGDGNGRRRLRGRRFGVVSERWRSASPSRCCRFFAAATAGDRSPTLGLQRIATFLDLVRLRLVASRTALRRGAVRMRGHRRWSRQREKSVRDGLLGGYLKQIYPVTIHNQISERREAQKTRHRQEHKHLMDLDQL